MDKKQLLTARDVTGEYGYSRSTLLRFEDEGILTPIRPGGTGQRRYHRSQLDNLATPVSKGDARQLDRPDYRELGTTGMRYAGGRLLEERLRELQGREGRILLREMRVNDPIIWAVFFALTSALRQANRRVKPASEKPADRQCAEWLDAQFDDMAFTWNDTMSFILDSGFEQGFSVQEIVYKRCRGETPGYYEDARTGHKVSLPQSKYSDGRIGWHKWSPRSAFTLSPGAEWVIDSYGDVLGINQSPEFFGNYSPPLTNPEAFPELGRDDAPGVYSIPIQKLLHFRTSVYPDNTPEGMPIHRAAYLPFYYTTNLQEIEGIGAERDLGGIPVIYMGRDLTVGSDPNSDYSLAKDLVTNVRMDEQMGIVFPGPKMGMAGEGNGWLFELASTQGRRQWDISAIIERYDKRKALTVLAQFILLGMERTGSYALSQSQGDLFTLAAKSWLKAIADDINRQCVQPLIRFNSFPGITGYPALVFSEVGIPDLAGIGEFVNKMVDKQIITPDPELERHLRHIANLPPPPPVKVQAPQQGNEQALEAADILRRVGMAVNPMLQQGVVSGDEAEGMLRPLVEGLQGTLQKAEVNPNLSPAGKKAVELTEGLEGSIRQAWANLMANIARGTDPQVALARYRQQAMALISAGLNEAWLTARQAPVTPAEQQVIDEAIAAQAAYLDNFMNQLQLELEQDRENQGGILLARAARAVMYAGSAWALFNLAKIFGARPEEVWKWEGPLEGACPDCQTELRLGPRPLSQITRFPGSVQCLSNCRHELVRVS